MGFAIYHIILYVSLAILAVSSFQRDILNVKSNRPEIKTRLTDLKFEDDPGYRLPTNLKPTLYDLKVQPFFNNNTFTGRVSILFDVINETQAIVLNARFESIQASSLTPDVTLSNGTKLPVANTTIDEEHQMVWFFLTESLAPQLNVTITVDYTGLLATDMMGFYLSTYSTLDSLGQKIQHVMAITQFESTYARRAFPCFDEPAYRAKFTLRIIRAPNQNSLANMELDESVNQTETGMVMDVYKTSPPMPTYLVAFGVSDLASESDGHTLRAFTRAAVLSDANFTVTVGQPILDSTGNFTGVPYPLHKMDVVAVPDFSAGAMENWGLTTFREKYVLYNAKKNTKRDLFLVLSVVAHEFGHQWFGDLVTPQWWDYTWLNEAFATYFEYTTPNRLFPEWGIGSSLYVTDALQPALDDDIGNTRPMTFPVYTPDQIEGIFDYVIYEKGGSVLRMMENFLTTAIWRDGLKRYLTANSFGTGTPDELFSAMEAAAIAANSSIADRVKATFTKWTTQPGYPVVKLHQEPKPSVYLVTQMPYELSNAGLSWSIPLSYTYQEQAEFDPSKADSLLLYNTGETFYINTTGWIILNVDQIGFFRVNYEEDNWNKIINQLKSNHTAIGVVNRAQLIDDAFHLARTGHVNYSIALELAGYLPQESGYAPWNAFFSNMRFLINQFYGTDVGNDLMQYARNIVGSPFHTLTSNLKASPESFLDSLTLLAASQFSCDVLLEECQNLASVAFVAWSQDPYSIPVETRQAVLCTELRLDSSGKSFQAVLEYYRKSDNGAEKRALLPTLGCTTSQTALNTYFDVICDVNGTLFRLQDRFIAFTTALQHQTAIPTALQYLINNYDRVSQALGSKFDSVFTTLGATISQATTISQLEAAINDTKVDARLRSKLQSIVLPPVIERRTWTQTPQALELQQWIRDYTKSSASSFLAQSVVVLALTSFAAYTL